MIGGGDGEEPPDSNYLIRDDCNSRHRIVYKFQLQYARLHPIAVRPSRQEVSEHGFYSSVTTRTRKSRGKCILESQSSPARRAKRDPRWSGPGRHPAPSSRPHQPPLVGLGTPEFDRLPSQAGAAAPSAHAGSKIPTHSTRSRSCCSAPHLLRSLTQERPPLLLTSLFPTFVLHLLSLSLSLSPSPSPSLSLSLPLSTRSLSSPPGESRFPYLVTSSRSRRRLDTLCFPPSHPVCNLSYMHCYRIENCYMRLERDRGQIAIALYHSRRRTASARREGGGNDCQHRSRQTRSAHRRLSNTTHHCYQLNSTQLNRFPARKTTSIYLESGKAKVGLFFDSFVHVVTSASHHHHLSSPRQRIVLWWRTNASGPLTASLSPLCSHTRHSYISSGAVADVGPI